MFSVVVPTYNESGNVEALIRAAVPVLRGLSEPVELLIVDDNSPDDTAGIATRCAAELGAEDCVRVLLRSEDRGLAKSVLAGFEAAKGDVLAVMDADLSHPPALLEQLLAAVRSGAEFAVASRYVPGGGVVNWPWRRRLISKVACWLAQPLVRVKDITSGYFAFQRQCLPASGLKPRGYKIGLEILARGGIQRIEEVPFQFKDREVGDSKLGSTVILAYLVQLLSLYRMRFPLLIGYLQFALVGLLGMAVDAAVFGLAYWYLGFVSWGASLGGFAAQSLSFLAAASLNFKLNVLWTFKERAAQAHWDRFLLVSLVGYLLRSLVFVGLVKAWGPTAEASGSWIGLPFEQWALFSSIMVASVWNYLASRSFAFPHSDDQPPPLPALREQAASGWLSLLLLSVFASSVFFAATTPLAADEAYYWQWSRHMAWGYFDHPPMIAYLVAAGTRLLGDVELGVRLLPVVLMTASSWLVYRLGYELTARRQAGLWAALGFLVTPLYAVGGSLATPDVPLVFFWLLSLWLAIYAHTRNTWTAWSAFGVALGLGLISKYSFAVLPVWLLLVCVSSAEGRRVLLRPGLYWAMVLAALVAMPMLWWNLQHDMASVNFQLGHGFATDAGRDAVGSVLEFFGAQLGVISPMLFVLCVWGLLASKRLLARQRGLAGGMSAQFAWRLLAWPSVLTVLLFAVASWHAKSEANWAAPAYLGALVLAGIALESRWDSLSRFWRSLVVLSLLLPGLGATYLRLEFSQPLLTYQSKFFSKMQDYSAVNDWLLSLQQQDANSSSVLIAGNYRIASLLAFYVAGQPEVDALLETGSGSAYHEWPAASCHAERAWFVASKPHPAGLEQFFANYRYVDSLNLQRKGETMQTLYAFVGPLLPAERRVGCQTQP